VTAAIAGGSEARPLGRAPIEVPKLTIVRKEFPSGAVDFWLMDGGGTLPTNDAKPAFASPEYSAGNEYPLDLVFTATLAGFEPTVEKVKIDRSTLQFLSDHKRPEFGIAIRLKHGASPTAGTPTAVTQGKMPRRRRGCKRRATGKRGARRVRDLPARCRSAEPRARNQ
jgi:hypothetical protein